MKPAERPAVQFYEVDYVRERLNSEQKVQRSAWTFLMTLFLPAGAEAYVPHATHPRMLGSVQVKRKADGRVVASYDYRDEESALNHARSLRQRLEEMSLGEFNDELGI